MDFPRSLRDACFPPEQKISPFSRPFWRLSRLAGLFQARRQHRSPESVAWSQVQGWFFAPLFLIVLLAWPHFKSPVPRDPNALASFLITLWQVHGSIAVVSTVVFVILLQTANFSKRTTSTVLKLALEARILSASAYGFSTTCAIGLVLLIDQQWGALTWAVVAIVISAFLSNVGFVLFVLTQSITFLAKSRLARIERENLIKQVERLAESEIREQISLKWLIEHFDKTSVTNFYFELPEGLPRWSVESHKSQMVSDINVEKLIQIGEDLQRRLSTDEPVIKLFARLEWSSRDDNVTIAEILGSHDKNLEREIRGCLTWSRKDEGDGEELLAGVLDQVQMSVTTGDITAFKDGLKICSDVLEATLGKLDQFGLARDEGVGQMSSFYAVHRMLRFALEEALKSGRPVFGQTAVHELAHLAELGIKFGNREAVRQLLLMYPFLRKVVLASEWKSDQSYREFYWRPLKELASWTSYGLDVNSQEFAETALVAISEAFLVMLKDSILEGGEDLDNLLNGWRLAFGEDDTRSALRTRRLSSSAEDLALKSHWISLLAWTVYLGISGQLEPRKFSFIFSKLAAKFTELNDVLAAAAHASRMGDDDRADLSGWLFSVLAEGQVHGIDERTPIAQACVIVLLLRASAPLSRKRFVPTRESSSAAEIAEDALKVVESLRGPSTLANLIVDSGLLSKVSKKPLDDLQQGFERVREEVKEQLRAVVRDSSLDQAVVNTFIEDVRTGYTSTNFFGSIPEVAKIDQNLKPYVKGQTFVGINELHDKRFFTTNGFGVFQLANNAVEMLSRGVQKSVLEGFAAESEDRRLVDRDKLLLELVEICRSQRQGCIVVQGVDARLNIERHPDFKYVDDKRQKGELGTLVGVPVFLGFDIQTFAALYLPYGSVQIAYAAVREGESHPVSNVVEFVDNHKAEEIVKSWTHSKAREFASTKEREEKVLELQETVALHIGVRPIAVCTGCTALLTSRHLDDDEDELTTEDELAPPQD